MTATADPSDWDAFVESSDPGSYLQLNAWAKVKAVSWRYEPGSLDSTEASQSPGSAGAVTIGADGGARRP